jgi:aspartyl-tRNA(Asn)/glutamyl-tRNA(Gln) amidotransferase subunit B
VAAGKGQVSPKSTANWVMGEVFRLLNETGLAVSDIKVSAGHLADLITLVENNTINRLAGKEVFAEMWQTGDAPEAIIEARGLKQISSADALQTIVEQVIAENPGPVSEFREGKEKVIGFLIGQVMRHSKGKANPKVAEQVLRETI